MTQPARVFISYARGPRDNDVLKLARRLRADGFEVALDQFEVGTPDLGWPLWMERNIEAADFVLLVCDATYLRRFQARERRGIGAGATFEGAILVRQDLYDSITRINKYYPVVFDERHVQYIPKLLRRATRFVLPAGYKQLVHALAGTRTAGHEVPDCAAEIDGPWLYLPTAAFPNQHDPSQESVTRRCARTLLDFVWRYPTRGGASSSWAIKDSALFLGDTDRATNHPTLGVALATTELAQKVFGSAAESRVDGCILWALSQAQTDPPYLVQVQHRDPVTSRPLILTDFRHTLALATILARWAKQPKRLHLYLLEVLDTQKADGGWPPSASVPDTEEFTVLYAVELLRLAESNFRDDRELVRQITTARKRAITWLCAATGKDDLWRSGVLPQDQCDALWTTSWIVHRMCSGDCPLENPLHTPILRAAKGMLRTLAQHDDGQPLPDEMRIRLYARVAGSVARLIRNTKVAEGSLHIDEFLLFLRGWGEAALHDYQDERVRLDLATAVYFLQAVFGDDAMKLMVPPEVGPGHAT